MMNVTLNEACLLLDVHGIDNLWTLNSHLEIPLTHVLGATYDPAFAAHPPEQRASPIHPPTLSAVGTIGVYLRDGQREFWDVRDPHKALAIRLQGEEYTRLVVEVADPHALLAQIEQALERLLEA